MRYQVQISPYVSGSLIDLVKYIREVARLDLSESLALARSGGTFGNFRRLEAISIRERFDRRFGLTSELVLIQPVFDGPTYESQHDQKRLSGQIGRVFETMKDGIYRTLDELSEATGSPMQSVSARLRDLRKTRFGSFTVNRRVRGDRNSGLYEYQLVVPQRGPFPLPESERDGTHIAFGRHAV